MIHIFGESSTCRAPFDGVGSVFCYRPRPKNDCLDRDATSA